MATKIVKNAGGLGSTTTLYTLGCRASGRILFDHGCSTVPTGAPLAILAQLKHIRVLQKTDPPLLIAMIAMIPWIALIALMVALTINAIARY